MSLDATSKAKAQSILTLMRSLPDFFLALAGRAATALEVRTRRLCHSSTLVWDDAAEEEEEQSGSS